MVSKELVIEKATRMFVKEGIKSVRMDDVAHEIGMSKRTLYELFSDKKELVYCAMTSYFEECRQDVLKKSENTENVLEKLFFIMADMLEHADTTYRLIDSVERFYPEVYAMILSKERAKDRQRLHQMLEQGIQEGLFISNFHIDLLISVLYYTVSTVKSPEHFQLPEDISPKQAFLQIIRNFFRGIATTEGLKLIDDYSKKYGLDHNHSLK